MTAKFAVATLVGTVVAAGEFSLYSMTNLQTLTNPGWKGEQGEEAQRSPSDP